MATFRLRSSSQDSTLRGTLRLRSGIRLLGGLTFRLRRVDGGATLEGGYRLRGTGQRFVNTASGTVTISGSAVEALRFTDSGSVTVSTGGSGSEGGVGEASGAGTFALNGSSLEEFTAEGSGTCTVTLSGTGVEGEAPPIPFGGGGLVPGYGKPKRKPRRIRLSVEAPEVVYEDAMGGVLALSGSAQEMFVVGDAAEGTVELVAAADGARLMADRAGGVVHVFGEGADALAFWGEARGSFGVDGDALEERTAGDATPGVLGVRGDSDGAVVYADVRNAVTRIAGAARDHRIVDSNGEGRILVFGAGGEVVAHRGRGVGHVDRHEPDPEPTIDEEFRQLLEDTLIACEA